MYFFLYFFIFFQFFKFQIKSLLKNLTLIFNNLLHTIIESLKIVQVVNLKLKKFIEVQWLEIYLGSCFL